MKDETVAKSNLVMLMAIMIVSGCATNDLPKPSGMTQTFRTEKWDEIVDSPAEICYYVRNRFEYSPDPIDSNGYQWMDSKLALALGKGDCEEFATIINEMCWEKKIPSSIYLFYSKKLSVCHAVTIGTFKGKMWMAENGMYYEVLSVEDAFDKYVEMANWNSDDIKWIRRP